MLQEPKPRAVGGVGFRDLMTRTRTRVLPFGSTGCMMKALTGLGSIALFFFFFFLFFFQMVLTLSVPELDLDLPLGLYNSRGGKHAVRICEIIFPLS